MNTFAVMISEKELVAIVDQFGAPVYVYDADTIANQYSQLKFCSVFHIGKMEKPMSYN